MKGRVKTNERFFNTRMCAVLSCLGKEIRRMDRAGVYSSRRYVW